MIMPESDLRLFKYQLDVVAKNQETTIHNLNKLLDEIRNLEKQHALIHQQLNAAEADVSTLKTDVSKLKTLADNQHGALKFMSIGALVISIVSTIIKFIG